MAQLNPSFVIDKNDIDSFEQIQLENDTQLARDNLLMHKAYKEPSDNDLIKNNCSAFTFVDFCPKLKRPARSFGWQLETFSQLFDRINIWLQLNDSWRVKSAETLIYDEATQFNRKYTSFSGCSLKQTTRAIRLWLVPAKNRFSPAQKIGCINVVPRARSSLSTGTTGNTSDPNGQNPKLSSRLRNGQQQQQQQQQQQLAQDSPYETLDEILKRLNDLLINRPIEGRILSVETITLPINGGYVDTETNCWPNNQPTATCDNGNQQPLAGKQTDMIDVLRVYYEFGPFRCGLVKMIDFVPQSISPLAPIPAPAANSHCADPPRLAGANNATCHTNNHSNNHNNNHNNSHNSSHNNSHNSSHNAAQHKSAQQAQQTSAQEQLHSEQCTSNTLNVMSLPNFESLTALIKRSVNWFRDNQHSLAALSGDIALVGAHHKTTQDTQQHTVRDRAAEVGCCTGSDATTNSDAAASLFGTAKFCNIQIRQKPLNDCWLLRNTISSADSTHLATCTGNYEQQQQPTGSAANDAAQLYNGCDNKPRDDKLNELIASQFNTRNMFYPGGGHSNNSCKQQQQLGSLSDAKHVQTPTKQADARDTATGEARRLRRKSTPTRPSLGAADLSSDEPQIGQPAVGFVSGESLIAPDKSDKQQQQQQWKQWKRRNTIHCHRRAASSDNSSQQDRNRKQPAGPCCATSGRQAASQAGRAASFSGYQLKFVRMAYVLPIEAVEAREAEDAKQREDALAQRPIEASFETIECEHDVAGLSGDASQTQRASAGASGNKKLFQVGLAPSGLTKAANKTANDALLCREQQIAASFRDLSLGTNSNNSPQHAPTAAEKSELTYRLFAPCQVINNSSAFVTSNRYNLPTVATSIHANPIYTVGRAARAPLNSLWSAGVVHSGRPVSFGGLMPAFVHHANNQSTINYGNKNNNNNNSNGEHNGSMTQQRVSLAATGCSDDNMPQQPQQQSLNQPATYDVLPLMMSSYNHQLIGDHNKYEQFESVKSMKKRLQVYVTSNAMKVLSAETLIVRLTNNNSSLTTAIDNCLSNSNQLLSDTLQSPMSGHFESTTRGAWVSVYILYCDATDNRLANRYYYNFVTNESHARHDIVDTTTIDSGSNNRATGQQSPVDNLNKTVTNEASQLGNDIQQQLSAVFDEARELAGPTTKHNTNDNSSGSTNQDDDNRLRKLTGSGHNQHGQQQQQQQQQDDDATIIDRVEEEWSCYMRDYYSSNDFKPYVRTIPLPCSPDDVELDDNGQLKQVTTSVNNNNSNATINHNVYNETLVSNRDQCSLM